MNVSNPKQIIDKFENSLNELLQSQEPILITIERAINLSSLALLDLREIVLTKGFEKQEEEIIFFKEQKPRVYCKFIYYGKLFKILCRRPLGTVNIQKKYFNQILETIVQHHNDNIEFYQYHRRGLTFLDEKFYTRESAEIPTNLNSLHFLIDKGFSTMQDHTLSTLLANELLTEYIQIELDKLEQTDSVLARLENEIFPELHWTESKTALTELIYALCSCGVINNGNVDIKEVVTIFEKIFNINLGDFYRIFIEIRNRKIDKTKFIDALKQSLLNRMNDADAK